MHICNIDSIASPIYNHFSVPREQKMDTITKSFSGKTNLRKCCEVEWKIRVEIKPLEDKKAPKQPKSPITDYIERLKNGLKVDEPLYRFP
jgi:hypothetical protein